MPKTSRGPIFIEIKHILRYLEQFKTRIKESIRLQSVYHAFNSFFLSGIAYSASFIYHHHRRRRRCHHHHYRFKKPLRCAPSPAPYKENDLTDLLKAEKLLCGSVHQRRQSDVKSWIRVKNSCFFQANFQKISIFSGKFSK